MPSSNDIISFKDVSYSYDGMSLALDGLTLSIEKGSFVCVLGGNGSGKSTLARHIDALLVPDSGEVRVFGLSTTERSNLYEIRSNCGLVFQNPDDQIVASIVEDDVAFGPENLGVPSADLPDRVRGALERVGLRGFEKRETFALSGGQKQRVAIAGTLAMKPKILVFDEPSAMLDPQGRKGLMRLCHKLNDAGFTIVLITHFMEEAAEADSVVVLDSGKVAMDGTPEEVLTEARRLRELALEVPFAAKMSLALQDAGVPVRTCIDGEELDVQLDELIGGEQSDSQKDVKEGVVQLRRRGACVPPESIISLQNVSYSYAPKHARKQSDKGHEGSHESHWGDVASDVWALRDITVSFCEGNFLGIAGHTGSGKSTLTQLMAGLIRPASGKVLAHGRNLVDRQSMHELRRSVGLVFQYPEHQLFAPTVFEDVAFGPRNLGMAPEEVEESVRSSLRLVHLDPDTIGQKNPFELSGGQQRRVALAGVLAMKPSVLILDEPTAGLDPRAHRMFLDLIAELHETSNAATVMVSHNMDDIVELCNRVLLLNQGELVADGDPSSVFSDEEAMRRIGLGVPHTVQLANHLGLMGEFDGIPTVSQLAEHIGEAWRRAQVGDGR